MKKELNAEEKALWEEIKEELASIVSGWEGDYVFDMIDTSGDYDEGVHADITVTHRLIPAVKTYLYVHAYKGQPMEMAFGEDTYVPLNRENFFIHMFYDVAGDLQSFKELHAM